MIQRNVKSTAKPLKSTQPKRSKAELQRGIVAKLRVRGIADPARATNEEMYLAVVSTLKEMIAENRNSFKKRAAAKESKKVCYLCMEFLIGRSLRNQAMNLHVYDKLRELLSEWGKTFDDIYACENDPGLGNGGLGRLAACFMDSLTAQGYFASGYSLCYEEGLFRQRIIDGEQIELPDEWLQGNGSYQPWGCYLHR